MKYNVIYNDPWKRTMITEPWVFWDQGFTPEELNRIEKYCDSQVLDIATTGTVGTESTPETVISHRVSGVKFHERNLDTAWFFDKMNFYIQSINESYYGFNLNGYSSFQYTTYTAEQKGRYDWHMDMSLGGHYGDQVDTRKLSMSLLLNDDFEGGEFQLNLGKEEDSVTAEMTKGRAIFFPSFVLHRVKPITKGVRKSIVIWVVGPKFS